MYDCIDGKGTQKVSHCPRCGVVRRTLVRCPVHGLADCGPETYAGSTCLACRGMEVNGESTFNR